MTPSTPFAPDEDITGYMVDLVSLEAEIAGQALQDGEKELLAERFSPGRPIPDEFRERAKCLILNILERERNTDAQGKSFAAAMESLDVEYPTIAALTEELAASGRLGGAAASQGAPTGSEKMQLIGCAITLVVALLMIGMMVSFFFARK